MPEAEQMQPFTAPDPLAGMEAADLASLGITGTDAQPRHAADAPTHADVVPPPVQVHSDPLIPDTSVAVPLPVDVPPPALAEPVPPVVVAPPVAEPLAEPPTGFQPDQQARERRLAERSQKELQRELQQERERLGTLEREREELRQQVQRMQTPPDELAPEIDPITQMQQEVAALRQQVQARQVDDSLNAQAREFAREHPDYDAAANHYIQSEIQRAESSGEIDMVAARLRQSVHGERIRQNAIERGMTEADVSRELAKGVLFEQRKAALVQGTQYTGKTVPQALYDMAVASGWKGNGNGNGHAAPAPVQMAPPSAADELRAEQRGAAESSLGSLSTSAGVPARQITSRSQFAALPYQEQIAHIEKMEAGAQLPRNHPNYVPADWHTLLTD